MKNTIALVTGSAAEIGVAGHPSFWGARRQRGDGKFG